MKYNSKIVAQTNFEFKNSFKLSFQIFYLDLFF